MPEDMKMKMARLRAMRKPKKGGQDPLEATLIQVGVPESAAKKLFKATDIDPSRVFLRSEWATMLPVISKINPAFGSVLSRLLQLDDFAKGKISTSDFAKAAAKEGFNQWVKPKIESTLKDVAKKVLQRGKGGKKRRPKRGGAEPSQASPFFNWLFGEDRALPDSGRDATMADTGRDVTETMPEIKQREESPFETAVGLTTEQNTFASDEVDALIPIVSKFSPQLGAYLALLQKGKKFLEKDVLEILNIPKEEIKQIINRSLEEYNDLFGDEQGFPDSLAEPNAARRGNDKSKGMAGFGCGCQEGRGQNGLAGDPSTNPRPKEYVIPVKQINSYTSQGDNRGAMSGWKAIGQSPNASSFAQVSF